MIGPTDESDNPSIPPGDGAPPSDSAPPALAVDTAGKADGTGVLSLSAACGLGVLVGLLVALSRTSIARDVVLGLVALLAAFLGLGTKAGAGNLHRTLGLCIGCTLSLLGGIWLRTHNALSPADRFTQVPQKQLVDWFGERDGRRLWLINQLGEIPPGVMGRPYAEAAPASGGSSKLHDTDTALVASENGTTEASCEQLVDQYDELKLGLDELSARYEKQPELRAIPKLVQSLEVKEPVRTTTALGRFACALAKQP